MDHFLSFSIFNGSKSNDATMDFEHFSSARLGFGLVQQTKIMVWLGKKFPVRSLNEIVHILL